MADTAKPRMAVIGLGSMGFGMATSLRRKGYEVTGCDVAADAVARFVKDGGKGAATLLGVLIALLWPAALIYAAVWVLLLLTIRISSVAGMSAAIAIMSSKLRGVATNTAAS